MNRLPYPLDTFGWKQSSQNDEDGVIAKIIDRIPMPRYFVEFGVELREGNCLRLHHAGWKGLFMDARGDGDLIKKEWVTPSNINDLLYKYQVSDIGVLSIDIDGQDWWVWKHLRREPKLVVIEYNGKLPKDSALITPRDDNFRIKDQGYGCSLWAMNMLGTRKGYTLVYANGVNAFFVLTDSFSNPDDFTYDNVYKAWPTETIEDPAALGFIPLDHHFDS